MPATARSYPQRGFQQQTGRELENDGHPGQGEDVDVRVAEEPPHVLDRYGLPPVDALKKDVVSVRSITSIMRAVTSIGAPSTMSTEVERTPRTKIGRRVQVIPGARWVSTWRSC